jgi:hypothetical protein
VGTSGFVLGTAEEQNAWRKACLPLDDVGYRRNE